MGVFAVPYGVISSLWILAFCAWIFHMVRFRQLATKLHKLIAIYPLFRFVWAVAMAACDGEYYEYEDFAVDTSAQLTSAGIAEGVFSALWGVAFWAVMLTCASGYCVLPGGPSKRTLGIIAGVAGADGVLALMRINMSVSSGYLFFVEIATLVVRITEFVMLLRFSKATVMKLGPLSQPGILPPPAMNEEESHSALEAWQIPMAGRFAAAEYFRKIALGFVLANFLYICLVFMLVIAGFVSYGDLFWLAEQLIWEFVYGGIFVLLVRTYRLRDPSSYTQLQQDVVLSGVPQAGPFSPIPGYVHAPMAHPGFAPSSPVMPVNHAYGGPGNVYAPQPMHPVQFYAQQPMPGDGVPNNPPQYAMPGYAAPPTMPYVANAAAIPGQQSPQLQQPYPGNVAQQQYAGNPQLQQQPYPSTAQNYV